MGPTSFYGARAEKTPFAIKQTNICRLSGDIIKHAVKLKTSPARLAQLLQPSLAFCFSWQPMTAHWTVLKQNAKEGCNSCASLAGLVLSFIACFILLVIAP